VPTPPAPPFGRFVVSDKGPRPLIFRRSAGMPLNRPEPFEVRPADPGEIVYRVLRGLEASVADFLPDELDPRSQTLARSGSTALARGISVRATLPQARRLARFLRRSHIAEVELTWEEGDAIARTLTTAGHHTLWAHPDLVFARVLAVHAV
jgi:hypothetical protein